jgi:5'-3' exonuclease
MAAEQIIGGHASIALVDLSYLFKKEWHSPSAKDSPEAAANNTLARLAGVRESVAHVIICCDWPPYRRKEIDPNYKAQREKPTEGEVAWKRWLMERIEKDGYQVARAKGYEADDVIATLCLAYSWCPDVRIIASDKDTAQCVSDNVRMFVPPVGDRPGEVRGVAEIVAKYGVAPKDMGLWIALCGDDSDNIPGVKGIGKVKATQLIQQCGSLKGIAEALAAGDPDEKPNAMWKALADNWETLVSSSKLTKLETDAPIDAVALLEKRVPAKLVADEESDDMMNGASTTQTNDVTDAEFDPISKAPDGYVAPPPERQKSEPPPAAETPKSIVKAKGYGAVTDGLQPTDLDSASTISKWIYEGRLYPQFTNAAAIFTVIMRGKEMGVGVTTSLAGFHMVQGRPCASADLIRSLAERDPDCEYFRLVESTPDSATWETKHRRHPEPTRYTYTLKEAQAAGMNTDPWKKRPRDMCAKTAGAKLARIVYPGATIGLYDPDEMGSAA